MESLKPSVLVLLSIMTLSIGVSDTVSGFFRITNYATVQNTDPMNQYLLKTIPFNPYTGGVYSCLSYCIRNSTCDIVVHDKDQNSCRLYRKTKLLSVTRITANTNVVYDKFLKNLWDYNTCNQSSAYRYYSAYDLCLYFNVSYLISWINAYQLCINLGGSLATLETVPNYQLVRNLTITNQLAVWLGSNTTIPSVFYWLDGSPINASYWNTGEPNNYLGNDTYVTEGCVLMNTNGLLNDSKCRNNQTFICQL